MIFSVHAQSALIRAKVFPDGKTEGFGKNQRCRFARLAGKPLCGCWSTPSALTSHSPYIADTVGDIATSTVAEKNCKAERLPVEIAAFPLYAPCAPFPTLRNCSRCQH